MTPSIANTMAGVTSTRALHGSRDASGADADANAVDAAVLLVAIGSGCLVAVTGPDALILCLSLIGCGLVLLDFRIGVVLLIVLMPISGSVWFPHAMLGVTGLNPFNLLLLGTFGALVLRRLTDRGRRQLLPRPLWWLYIVPLLAAGAIGSRHVGEIVPAFYVHDMIAFHDVPGYLRDVVAKPLLMVVYALLVAAAAAGSQRPQRLLIAAIGSIWVMGGMAIVFVLVGGASLGQLASSTQREFLSPLGLHANELGRLYTFACALLLFSWSASHRAAVKLLLAASIALVAIALLLTYSRSAFLGCAVVSALFALWRRKGSTPLLPGFVVLVVVFADPAALYERLTAGFGAGLNEVSAGRIDGLWLPLLPEVLRSPVYGHGLGSILWSEAMRRGGGAAVLAVTHPHSAYLQALLDMGLAGLLLLGAYFAHVWTRLRRLAADPELDPLLRRFFEGASAGLLAFLLTGLFDSSLLPKPEHALLWLAIGMMYGQRAGKEASR
jgi:O-antigen ligase